MHADRAMALEQLRTLLDARGLSRPVPRADCLATGLPDLDALLGGWPRPGLVEISGLPGSGRLGLILPLIVRETRRGRVVGLVDVLERFHPPALVGIEPSRLLLVRPGGERAVWVTEQLAASGALACTVLLDPLPLRRGGIRLLRAAERGGSLVVVLAEREDPACPATVRLAVGGTPEAAVRVKVLRRRQGPPVSATLVSLQPEGEAGAAGPT